MDEWTRITVRDLENDKARLVKERDEYKKKAEELADQLRSTEALGNALYGAVVATQNPDADPEEGGRAIAAAVEGWEEAIEPPGFVGPTGEFPNGKVSPDDAGELAMGVGIKNDQVYLVFKTPVAWIGMGPDDARGLAASLKEKADALGK